MKKILFIFVLVLLFALSSCISFAVRTVRHIPLTEEEQHIANLTSDMVHRFRLEEEKSYDISIYFYHNGTIESIGEVHGIDTANDTKDVLIAGRRDGDVAFAWSIGVEGSIAMFSATDIDDDRELVMMKGIANNMFFMDEGVEYGLIYVAYKEGNEFDTSDLFVFEAWDFVESYEEKIDKLSPFTYAYIITIQLGVETE